MMMMTMMTAAAVIAAVTAATAAVKMMMTTIAMVEEEEDEGALEDALLDINGDLLGFPPRPVQTGGATGGLGGAGAGLADGLFVQVRGTGDPAAREEVLTRDGPISLARDAVQWVRLDSTVHALLKQGRLVHFQ